MRLNSTVELTSSLTNESLPRWPTQLALSGIFDFNPRRNPFAGANLVHIGYCSSDSWVGNSNPADNPLNATANAAGSLGWYFKGSRILEATMAVLVQSFGLGSNPGTRLLFGGCSSGARGAMYTLDSVAAMVPAGVQVRGLLDSPLWVYKNPLEPTVVPLDEQVREAWTTPTTPTPKPQPTLSVTSGSAQPRPPHSASAAPLRPALCVFTTAGLAAVQQHPSQLRRNLCQGQPWREPVEVRSAESRNPERHSALSAGEFAHACASSAGVCTASIACRTSRRRTSCRRHRRVHKQSCVG